MMRYVALFAIIYMVEKCSVLAPPPPVRLTIDCGSQEKASSSRELLRAKSSESTRNRNNLDINTICGFIQNSLPKTVKDGRFVLQDEPDQTAYETDPIPIKALPPKSFIPKLEPKLRLPKIKVPKFNVPKLKIYKDHKPAPRVGKPMTFQTHIFRPDEATSAEKMEKVKKAVHKMLHVVKVLGKIDEYISERIKIIVEKIAQTFE